MLTVPSHDVVRGEPLQAPHRLPVVSELRVVVVFDDDRPAPDRPGDEFQPPRRRQDDSSRPLVHRGDEDGGRAAGVKRRHVDALLIHGHGDRRQARPADGGGHARHLAGELEGDPVNAASSQSAQDKPQALPRPRADEHLARVDVHGPDAAPVGSKDLAQPVAASRVAVVELGVRRGPARLAHRPRSVIARHRGEVRHSRLEADGAGAGVVRT